MEYEQPDMDYSGPWHIVGSRAGASARQMLPQPRVRACTLGQQAIGRRPQSDLTPTACLVQCASMALHFGLK